MKFKLKPIKEPTYEPGQYYGDAHSERVVVIIEDLERGFALMDVETARTTSDFYEEIEFLQNYTTVEEMVQLIQVNEVEFEEYEI